LATKFVHPDFLPKMYGGNLDWDCPKPILTQEIKDSIPPIPKKKWEKAYAGRGASYEFGVEVMEITTTLDWEFQTDSYDIGFGLKFRSSLDDTVEDLLAIERVDSHKSSVYGSWVAEKTGHYVLSWDNTYSWAHGKDIKYFVRVSSPAGTDTIDDASVSTSSKSSKSGKSPEKKKRKGK